jgi:prophage regulatory protein
MLKPAYIDLPATAQFTALSESTVQKLVRESEFPKPRLLSGRRVAWLVRELEEWAEARPVADLLPPSNCGYGKLGKPVAQLA